MYSLSLLFWTWLIGGLTFFPTLLILALIIILKLSPKATAHEFDRAVGSSAETKTLLDEPATILRQGWVRVRRTFEAEAGEGTYVGMLTSGYKSFLDSRSKDPRKNRAKDEFFAVLKQTLSSNVLFLHDADPSTSTPQAPVDCFAAIDVTLHEVSIHPAQDAADGELWMRKNGIKLRPKSSVPVDVIDSPSVHEVTDDTVEPGRPLPWYLFTKTNYEKEDWYFSLVNASNATDKAQDKAMFEAEDMVHLMEAIDVHADSATVRWFNAMFGRLFLGVCKTAALENYIVSRIVRKLNKVNKPSYLSEIRVREVNVGTTPPLFGRPILKELSADGTACMETALRFRGDLRITISTVASINLSARFKDYKVALVLAVVLKELDGNLQLRIKKPPSNRIWFAFTSMPKMTLSIEPVVSDRKIKWSMVTKSIESRIREIVLESVVAPHFDDIPFFDTKPYSHRGGIFGDAMRKNEELATADIDTDAEEGEPAEAPDADPADLDHTAAESGLRQRDSDNASLKTVDGALPRKAGEANHQKRKSWFASSKNLLSPSSDSLASNGSSSSVPHRVPPPFVRKESEGVESDTATARLTKVLQTDQAKAQSSLLASRSRASSLQATNSAPAVPTLNSDRPILPRRASPDDLTLSSETSSLNPPNLPSRQTSVSSHLSNVSSVIQAPTEIMQPISTSASRSESPDKHLPAQRSPAPSPQPSFLPPPQRKAPASPSLDHEQPTEGSSSLLNAWRAKAADKQALAAGVNSAKDAMRRWGANWSKGRDLADAQPVAEPVVNVGSPPKLVTRSSSISKANAFVPSPSQPTLSLSNADTSPPRRIITASLPPPSSAGYKAASMMAIPAISNPAHRGGLGSEGVLDIRPQRPGDEPVQPEKRRILPPLWPERSPPDLRAVSSPAKPIHRVPPAAARPEGPMSSPPTEMKPTPAAMLAPPMTIVESSGSADSSATEVPVLSDQPASAASSTNQRSPAKEIHRVPPPMLGPTVQTGFAVTAETSKHIVPTDIPLTAPSTSEVVTRGAPSSVAIEPGEALDKLIAAHTDEKVDDEHDEQWGI